MGVTGTTIGEGATLDGHGVISVVDLEHTDDFFVAVDDEVATKLVALFFGLDKSCWWETLEMAAIGLEHNGD